jgi:tetratricopeptide (TPR) repeat protein
LLSPAARVLSMKCMMVLDWLRRHKFKIIALVLVVAAPAVMVVTIWSFFQNRELRRLRATAVAAREMAEGCLQSNRLAEADVLCRTAIDVLGKLATRTRDPQIRFENAIALETLAAIQVAMDQPDQAEKPFEQAIALYDKLVFNDSSAIEFRERAARCMLRFAPMFNESGRWDEAEGVLQHGLNACMFRLTSAPLDPRLDDEQVLLKNQLGLLYQRTGRVTEALEEFARAVAVQNDVVARSSATGDDRALLISIMLNQAQTFSAANQEDAAERVLVKSSEVAGKLCEDFPTIERFRDLAATALEREGDQIARDPGRAAEARRHFERALVLRESLVASTPAPDRLDKLAETCHRLADSFLEAKSFEKAEEFQRRELLHRLRLEQDHPGLPAYRFGRGEALHNLAELLRQRGRTEEALPLERQAAPLLADVYRENVHNLEHRRAVSCAYWALCALEIARNDHGAAARAISAYQSIEPNGYEEAHEAAGFLCQCAQLCGDDHELRAPEKERLARAYADRAIGALETAVREGFRDLNELTTSPVYEPIRGRPEFSRLVHKVAAIVEAVKEG